MPALIVNNYKPIGETVDFDEFAAWSKRNPNWSNELSSNAMSSGFGGVVDALVEKLREFKNSV